ncbi:MAG: branched-chain amino acid aminotransferase [ANME-2 cluster archaeon]|nr:branched-chain amino acid aminotransferase [ANME-2 cluster archaeon]MBC2699926.1 branched-chain amino acid aminotransferase [ANME-2 cluster archaeon]MBC2706237.1 branched-chain amino acid aminotransferase [ANME-2 cluster archaeon]MBC2748076.1 branched-chain amino acid aminotransferase [ANME-2 cluster archaeon]MBC2762468.1 branched-chain amino acid aminotransferase [ANME-2 cluster archaeon]
MSDIKITKSKTSKIDSVDFENLGFGEVFSDHMFSMDYENGEWINQRIEPYGKIEFEPAMCTLHYAQAVFEGLKAFHVKDGSINIFRPEKNLDRMNRSNERMCMPTIDKDMFFDAMNELVKLERDWIPKDTGHSLYIRPFMFGTENFLGVHPSSTYRFMIILSPVGAYYKEGFNPVSLLVPEEYVRAVKGGVGEAKTAGNYAASLLPARIAQEKGFTQVLWLDGEHHKYIDEVGTMNIFFVIDDEVITPPLEGSILPGVTRDTALDLTKSWGMKVSERRISIDELIQSSKEGRLQEVFGTGTAAVISPVDEIQYRDTNININEGQIGPIARRLFDEISGIQYGEISDTHGWIYNIP